MNITKPSICLFIPTQKKKAGSVRLALNTVRVNIGTLKPQTSVSILTRLSYNTKKALNILKSPTNAMNLRKCYQKKIYINKYMKGLFKGQVLKLEIGTYIKEVFENDLFSGIKEPGCKREL